MDIKPDEKVKTSAENGESEGIITNSFEGSNAISYRLIDMVKDVDFLEGMKSTKRKIPCTIRSRYNFGYAEVEIKELDKSVYYAYSRIKNIESLDNLNLTSKQKLDLKDISIEPTIGE